MLVQGSRIRKGALAVDGVAGGGWRCAQCARGEDDLVVWRRCCIFWRRPSGSCTSILEWTASGENVCGCPAVLSLRSKWCERSRCGDCGRKFATVCSRKLQKDGPAWNSASNSLLMRRCLERLTCTAQSPKDNGCVLAKPMFIAEPRWTGSGVRDLTSRRTWQKCGAGRRGRRL